MEEFTKMVRGMSVDELRSGIAIMKDFLNRKTTSNLCVGDKVRFTNPKRNVVVTATVTKINSKSIKCVDDATRVTWRVHPSFINRV